MNRQISWDKNYFMRRLFISAGFYFNNSGRILRRRLAQWERANKRKPASAEELREACGIKSTAAWVAFLSTWFAANGVTRSAGASLTTAEIKDATGDVTVIVQMGEDDGKQPTTEQKESEGGESDDDLKGDMKDADSEFSAQMKTLRKELDTLRQNAEKEIETAKRDVEARLALKDAELRRMQDEREGPVNVVVTRADGSSTRIDRQHKTFPALLKRCQARVNVYLVGPAGSGKTTAAENAAEALGLEFGFMSVGPQTTKSDIMGFVGPSGNYVATEFRRRYEFGGVFLFDEIDSGNGGVLTCVNAALAGKSCSFPDKTVKRHPDFVCIAAGNTYGTGPDRIYVGRQELDGASLDRFNFLEWDYDTGLELAIAQTIDAKNADAWVRYVVEFRKSVQKLSIRHVVSPRASFEGLRLLAVGVTPREIVTTQIHKSLKPADVVRIEAGAPDLLNIARLEAALKA